MYYCLLKENGACGLRPLYGTTYGKSIYADDPGGTGLKTPPLLSPPLPPCVLLVVAGVREGTREGW